MKLDTARSLVTAAFGRMNALYQKTVFDEWVVVSLQADRGGILAYHGPRVDGFRKQFVDDIGPLRAEMTGKHFAVGDFEFAPEATGTRYDVCLRTGETSYLIGNHTGKSMTEIRQDQRWLQAQKAFVELSNKFRTDPLE
ncbi:MAG: hypothetical protein PHE83_11570 [Opitutaceae bacterium]|nr:hypothetical protein [Opitutaceae bacterium]